MPRPEVPAPRAHRRRQLGGADHKLLALRPVQLPQEVRAKAHLDPCSRGRAYTYLITFLLAAGAGAGSGQGRTGAGLGGMELLQACMGAGVSPTAGQWWTAAKQAVRTQNKVLSGGAMQATKVPAHDTHPLGEQPPASQAPPAQGPPPTAKQCHRWGARGMGWLCAKLVQGLLAFLAPSCSKAGSLQGATGARCRERQRNTRPAIT